MITRELTQSLSAAAKVSPHPTIELTADQATLYCAELQPLRFDWFDYPAAFAAYMNGLQPGKVEVARLRLVPDRG